MTESVEKITGRLDELANLIYYLDEYEPDKLEIRNYLTIRKVHWELLKDMTLYDMEGDNHE